MIKVTKVKEVGCLAQKAPKELFFQKNSALSPDPGFRRSVITGCQLPADDLDPFSLFSQPMIAYLKGGFVYKSPAVVHVDVNGVGYEVQISLNTFTNIQHLDSGTLYTALLIREDAHILYGFFDITEKEMFLQLLSVSGIGASTARVILSYMKPDELAKTIIHGDSRTLEGIKGIGKKTAERMVLELKDKLVKFNAGTNNLPMKNNTLHHDALNALTALGISRQAAGQALEKVLAVNSNLPVEELVKLALRTL